MTTEVAKFMGSVLLAVETARILPTQDAPAIKSDDQKEAYDALAHKIYDELEGPPEERAQSPQGKLANRLWQRIAEWDERQRRE